jgi:tetratricopeptide (TPR) repeat protein
MALRLFFLPWPLSVDHPLAPWPDPAALRLTGLAAAWCAIALFAWCSRGPAARRAGFFALWAVIAALPTTVWPLNVPFQEHRAYLQHAGLAALAAPGLIALLDVRRVGRTAAVLTGIAALIACAWLIREQGLRWSDPVRLWEHARLTAPTSFRAHTNAGLALAAAGRWDDAAGALATALTLNPNYPTALVARGVIAHRRGQRTAAAADYERAAALRPEYVPALFNRGLLAQEMNDLAGAEPWYRRVLAINRLHANTLLNLGVLLLAQGRTAEADAVFAAGRAAAPRVPAVLYYSGIVAERLARVGDAVAYYREARSTALARGQQALADDASARLSALHAE